MKWVCFAIQCLTLTIGCLLASQTANAQAPSSIQLFMPNGGGPPSQVMRLTLVRDDGFIDTVFTDSKGKYSITTPKGGGTTVFYTVTVETDNQTYATTTATFRLDPNNPNQTAIFLRPLTAAKSAVPAVVDVTNFEGNVPSKARAAYKRGMDFVGEGKLESAIPSLQEAISIYPQYVRALNDLGVAYLKLSQLDEAAATFRKATEISKRFFHPRMNLGIVLNKQRKYREALEVLEPLYNENRGMLEVRLAYANALEGAGELAEAEKLYRSTLGSKNLPNSAQAVLQFKLGVILNRQGRYADAASELEQAIMLDHEVANFHLQLGGALMQLQEYDRAEKELLRAYELGGSAAGAAQLLLGHIYYAERKLADAQKAFEQFLRDVPAAPNAEAIAKLISELKTTPKN
jgi:tetratricopeptide (TPR) repeat protein